MNNLRTVFLLGTLTALLLFAGGMMGGQQGLTMALFMAGLMNFIAYFWSHKIVLAMYGAKEVSEAEAPDLHRIVNELAMRAGIPKPRVFIMPSEAPNAFATGRNPQHGVVAVTQGTLKLLSRNELEGVLAHEMGHIKNRDILIATMAATIAGAIGYLAHMAQFAAIFGGGRSDDDDRGGAGSLIFMAILIPIIAMLIQMAVSRSREYVADETGARLAGNPFGLADALQKLQAYSQRIPMGANPGTAHLFIVSPLSGRGVIQLLSTHPPIEERIARLRSMTF
ncbi:MAG: zinc metalloprotease HtpX [Nitrospirae bacterium]|nr:zinc metalloprotease HtpX [Nitrospirota bacterium]